MESKQIINEFLNDRPAVCGAYGYGSGVFKQNNYNGEVNPQIDLILIVEDMKEWHKENIEKNPTDYSFLGRIRLGHITREAMKGKNHVTYCTSIKVNNHLFKYGLIEEKDFIKDLQTWEPFYVAGRFQKPTLEVVTNDVIKKVINIDRRSAFLIACIFCDKETTLHELFCKICGLSYMGDFRMGIAENPDKIKNIVDGSYDILKEIYSGYNYYVEYLGDDKVRIRHNRIISDMSLLLSQKLFDKLDYMDDISIESLRIYFTNYFKDRNFSESASQAINGFLNNGLIKSAPYAVSKISKKFSKKLVP